WATAPFLHNNSCGLFNNDPSVAGRLRAFDDGIKRLLVHNGTKLQDEDWFHPERPPLADVAALRWKSDIDLNGATAKRLAADRGLVWRTPAPTRLHIAEKYIRELAVSSTRGTRYEASTWLFSGTARLLLPAALLLVAALVLSGRGAGDPRRRLKGGRRFFGYAVAASSLGLL